MKKVLIGVGVVGLLGVIGLYVLGQKQSTNEPVTTTTTTTTVTETESKTPGTTDSSQMAKEEVAVKLTDKGFDPKTITIKVGTTVTWTNETDEQMWVASALHPTHLELPGFDQLTSSGKGSTYTYTFVKAGTWKYHNHVNASQFGVVVVTE